MKAINEDLIDAACYLAQFYDNVFQGWCCKAEKREEELYHDYATLCRTFLFLLDANAFEIESYKEKKNE